MQPSTGTYHNHLHRIFLPNLKIANGKNKLARNIITLYLSKMNLDSGMSLNEYLQYVELLETTLYSYFTPDVRNAVKTELLEKAENLVHCNKTLRPGTVKSGHCQISQYQ